MKYFFGISPLYSSANKQKGISVSSKFETFSKYLRFFWTSKLSVSIVHFVMTGWSWLLECNKFLKKVQDLCVLLFHPIWILIVLVRLWKNNCFRFPTSVQTYKQVSLSRDSLPISFTMVVTNLVSDTFDKCHFLLSKVLFNRFYYSWANGSTDICLSKAYLSLSKWFSLSNILNPMIQSILVWVL